MEKSKLSTILFAGIALAFFTISAYAVPPKVAKAIPENGDQSVDPSLRQIRIEFDQDMSQGGYSVCGGGPKYPKTIGKPKWINKRTLAMRVKLQPNHEYELSVNCQSYRNFKNLQGESAVIYPIKFKTTTAGEKSITPTKSPSLLLQEGLYAEETEGDLEKAIGIYQQVIDEAGKIQRLAAKATYQLGMCYLKKGEKEKAAEYFQQVVSNYSTQQVIVEKARQQLEKVRPAMSASIPQIIHTNPTALANDVDPSLDKITVLFNTKMMDQSWSWTGGGDTYPQTTGKPSYDETKTICTLPVKLEPGKVYWVGINSPSYKNFQTVGHEPAKRYVILFATKTADGKPTSISDDLLTQAEAINGLTTAVQSSGYIENLKNKITISTAKSPDGDRLTVQYAAIEICKAANVPYQWDKSQKLAGEKVKQYIEPINFENIAAYEVLNSILEKVGLIYAVDDSGVYLTDVSKTVEKAVLTISTCAEGDPRIKTVMEPLKLLDDNAVVKELIKYLNSDENEVRRSAIYVLWRGEFSSIVPAVPQLEKLCSHTEDLTRGMAALALGQNKAKSSFSILEKMTLNDQSGYARRCGAYALGLIGDPQAKSILEKALNDPDKLVQGNAKAALRMFQLEPK